MLGAINLITTIVNMRSPGGGNIINNRMILQLKEINGSIIKYKPNKYKDVITLEQIKIMQKSIKEVITRSLLGG